MYKGSLSVYFFSYRLEIIIFLCTVQKFRLIHATDLFYWYYYFYLFISFFFIFVAVVIDDVIIIIIMSVAPYNIPRVVRTCDGLKSRKRVRNIQCIVTLQNRLTVIARRAPSRRRVCVVRPNRRNTFWATANETE